MYNKSEYHLENAAKARAKANSLKIQCPFCNKITAKGNATKHQNFCYLNPINTKFCEICNNPIKNYKTSITCSYSCSNKKFRSIPRNNTKYNKQSSYSYRYICFTHHKKECIICKENNIVSVHHFDDNHKNNNPKNLIPLCPTHHQYVHSKYKHLIIDKIHTYIEKWSPAPDSNRQFPDSKSGSLTN